LKSVLEIQNVYQDDFSNENSTASVLGFQNKIFEQGFHESENVVNILSIN